jgi:hypothetical protein
MRDSTVIDEFVGDYESDGLVPIKDPDKVHYYPRKGVKLALFKVLLIGTTEKAYAKIRIKEDGEPFAAKLSLERAVFKVLDGDLIADNIEVEPGLLLQERLTMQKNSNGEKEMKHTLKFSDDSLGTWICKN